MLCYQKTTTYFNNCASTLHTTATQVTFLNNLPSCRFLIRSKNEVEKENKIQKWEKRTKAVENSAYAGAPTKICEPEKT